MVVTNSRRFSKGAGIVLALLTIGITGNLRALDLQLRPSVDSTAQAGQTVTWTAVPDGATTPRFRFRARRLGEDFQMIQDFGPTATLDWAQLREGRYELEASVLDLDTNATVTTSQVLQIVSRLTSDQPVVNPTDHPQVFLFSAPPCPAGSRLRILFRANGGTTQRTPYRNCLPAESMNFYLAGLYANTAYSAQTQIDSGDDITLGSPVPFQTGDVPTFSWSQSVVKALPTGEAQQLLLATSGGTQVVTDLSGNTLWFNPNPVTYATRFETGGYLWGFLEDDSKSIEQQGIRKVDLAGHILLTTNAERVNAQLTALGKRPISGFHHEVRTLPDGRIAALASVEQVLTNVQGPGHIDILGDMIIVFDKNLQVVWTWDTFDHLDVTRKATLGETCAPGGGGCAPFYLAPVANDWTHGNALQQTPDGNLLYSARHQDWLIKIAYGNGEGDGHILWRLGKDGDFNYTGFTDYPWFSHQHDGNFESATRLAVFDNGNTRVSSQGQGHSRGQVIELDEAKRTATLLLNADLGVYSLAVGSAQLLADGNHHFDAGYVPSASGISAYALEVDADGNLIGSLMANTLLYRSIRLKSMYGMN